MENSHPAIIKPEQFDLVQEEIKRRKKAGIRQSSASIFSSKIICGECGNFYGSKVWQSSNKYKRTVWQCNGKYRQHAYCSTPHLTAEEIQRAFVSVVNQIFEEKDHLIEDYALIIQELTDCSQLDEELAKQQEECEIVGELVRRYIEENARSTQNQSDYQQRYDSLAERYAAAHQRLDALIEKKQERAVRSKNIQRFMEDLRKQEVLLTDFDEELWIRMVESVTVFTGKDCRFNLKDGSEVHIRIT